MTKRVLACWWESPSSLPHCLTLWFGPNTGTLSAFRRQIAVVCYSQENPALDVFTPHTHPGLFVFLLIHFQGYGESSLVKDVEVPTKLREREWLQNEPVWVRAWMLFFPYGFNVRTVKRKMPQQKSTPPRLGTATHRHHHCPWNGRGVFWHGGLQQRAHWRHCPCLTRGIYRWRKHASRWWTFLSGCSVYLWHVLQPYSKTDVLYHPEKFTVNKSYAVHFSLSPLLTVLSVAPL